MTAHNQYSNGVMTVCRDVQLSSADQRLSSAKQLQQCDRNVDQLRHESVPNHPQVC